MESEPTPPYSKECIISIIAKKAYRDFAGGPVTLQSQSRRPGFHLWSETELHPTCHNYEFTRHNERFHMLQQRSKILSVTTKAQCSSINKYIFFKKKSTQ